jgi:hypothetical protein
VNKNIYLADDLIFSAARLIRELYMSNTKLQHQLYNSCHTGSEIPPSYVGGPPTAISSKCVLSAGNLHVIDCQQVQVRRVHIPRYFTNISSSNQTAPISSQTYRQLICIHVPPAHAMNYTMPTWHRETWRPLPCMIRSSARWILIWVRVASIIIMANTYHNYV